MTLLTGIGASWSQGHAARLSGFHNGYSLLEPYHSFERVHCSYGKGLDAPVNTLLGTPAEGVTVRNVIDSIIASGQTPVICADFHLNLPERGGYHKDPRFLPEAEWKWYVQYMNVAEYARWVWDMHLQYPTAVIQLGNETGYQRGKGVSAERYASIVRTVLYTDVPPQNILAGLGTGTPEVAAWEKDLAWMGESPKAVMRGYHHNILHQPMSDEELYLSYWNLAVDLKAQDPDRPLVLDETNPHGMVPGGTTTEEGANDWLVGCEVGDDLIETRNLDAIGFGFVGGLGPVCDPLWGCHSLLDISGHGTRAALAFIEAGDKYGWRREGVPSPPPPPKPPEDEVTREEFNALCEIVSDIAGRLKNGQPALKAVDAGSTRLACHADRYTFKKGQRDKFDELAKAARALKKGLGTSGPEQPKPGASDAEVLAAVDRFIERCAGNATIAVAARGRRIQADYLNHSDGTSVGVHQTIGGPSRESFIKAVEHLEGK